MDPLTSGTMDHKATKVELQENCESFMALAENANDGILIAAAEGVHIYANRRASEITGYSVAELLKTSIKDLAAPDELENLMEKFRKRISGEDIPKQYETVIIRKDGKSVPIEITAAKTIWQGQPADLVILRDITERKWVVEALRDSLSRYRILADNSPSMIYLIDPEGYVRFVNPVAAAQFGFSQDEITGKHLREIFPLAQAGQHLNVIHSILNQGVGRSFELREVFPTGERWIDARLVPVKAENGTIIGVLGISHDITDHKRAEEALQESKEFLNKIINSLSDPIHVKDRQHRIILINDAACMFFNKSREEILGKTAYELFFKKEMADISWQKDEEVFRTGKESVNVETNTYAPGKTLTVLVKKTLYTDTAKNQFLVGITTDITEHTRMEDALRESEDKYRTLVENIRDGIYTLDCQGNFQFVNDEIVHRSGHSAEWFIGRNFLDVISPEYHKPVQKFFEMVMEGKIPPIYETAYPTSSGTLFYVELKTSPIFKNDNVVGLLGISRDINERKRAEDALRESEAKYRLIADNTSDSIWIFDMDMHLQYISPSVKKMKGFTVEETLSQSLEEMMTPASYEQLIKRFQQEMVLEASGTADPDRTVSFETEEYCKSGATILVENSVNLIRNAQGRPVLMLGISRDITERKKADRALRESEEKYRALVDHGIDPVIICDFTGKALFVNQAVVLLLKAERVDDIAGRNVLEFVAPESQEAVISDLSHVLQGNDAYLAVYRILDLKGNMIWVETIGKRIQYEGKPADLVSFRDITERKRAEEMLKESEERYSIVTDAAHDAIYALTPAGVVTFMNSGGSALIGIPPEKIAGLSLESLYHTEIAQELQENLEKVISTKRPVQFDAKFWHGNKDQVTWLDTRLVPQFGPDGSVIRVIGISRSITDRKQAELLLKRFNLELESQVRSRTVDLEHLNTLLEAEVIQRTMAEDSMRNSLHERELLLREIHHRVKNNLQIILSLISLQSRNIKDPYLLDTLGDFQNRIKAMAHVHERMCLVDDISRIDLSEIVTFMGSSLFRSYKVDSHHIRLNVGIKDLQITIDSAIPISLILNELITNSIKHAFPGGTSGEITVTGQREAGMLVLSVRDTGIGIPKDIDWMNSTQSLGHRLVMNLVEQLNGTIELDQTTGTAFNIVVKEKE